MAETKASTDKPDADDSTKEPVFDVAKPGSSPASATSRPIIGHRAMMRDPMMASEAPADDDTEAKPEAPLTSKGKTIQPSEGSDLETKPDEAPASTAVTEQPEPEQEPAAPKKSLEEAAVDAYADQMVKKKKKPTKEDEEKLAQIQKHIEEKTYFVPIGQVKKRRAKRRLSVVFALLVLIVAVYFVLDANLLGLDIVLPIEFIE